MSLAPDLVPPQDAGVESETIGFDFGPALQPGDYVTSVVTTSCIAVTGTDPDASTRLTGSTILVPSNKTGANNCQVNKTFQHALAGVRYRLQCIAIMFSGQQKSIIVHISGQDN